MGRLNIKKNQGKCARCGVVSKLRRSLNITNNLCLKCASEVQYVLPKKIK